jgi:hypothetical protein
MHHAMSIGIRNPDSTLTIKGNATSAVISLDIKEWLRDDQAICAASMENDSSGIFQECEMVPREIEGGDLTGTPESIQQFSGSVQQLH